MTHLLSSPPWTDLHQIWFRVGVADVITHDTFLGDRLKGSICRGGGCLHWCLHWQSMSPLTLCCRYHTASEKTP